MSFDIFENIYTASDPAGGRAIKVSTTAGIDNADSYYTVSDPAGGRALKVKIITGGGGGSNGTLQVAGGVALSSTLRSITDSVGNFSPMYLSTGSLELRTTPTTGTYLFTIDGGAFSSYANIKCGDEQSSVLEFTTGASSLNIGDIRANSANGIALTSGVAFPIKFYTNGDYVNTAAEFDTVGTLNTYYSITLNDLNSTGNSKITFNYNGTNTQIGLISATESNFEVSSKNGRPLWLSTGGNDGSIIIDNDGTVNIGTHLSINGNSGNGYIHLTTQASSPAGVVNKISLWSDSSNRLSWRQGTGFSVTLDNSLLTANRLHKFPNTDTVLAGLSVVQTFDAAQTIQKNAIGPAYSPMLSMMNTSAAVSATTNQWSPALMFQGSFWNGSTSVTGAFRVYVKQTGNTSAGVGHLVFGYSNNGGAEVESFRIAHSGAIYINNTAGWVANMGGSSGAMKLTDGSGNPATNARLQFGEHVGVVAPMLRRNGANLELKFGDDTYGSGFSVGGALVGSAILQADSTAKGFLPPRMTTTDVNAIVSPADGLVVYNTTLGHLCVRAAGVWHKLSQSTM